MAEEGVNRIVQFGFGGPPGATGPAGPTGPAGAGGDLDGDVIPDLGDPELNIVASISGDDGEVFVPSATYFRLFGSNGPAFGKFRMPYSGSDRSIFSVKTDEAADANVLRTQGILVELGDDKLATDIRGIDLRLFFGDFANGCGFVKVDSEGATTSVGGFTGVGKFISAFGVESPTVKLVPELISDQGPTGGIGEYGDTFSTQGYYGEQIAADGSPVGILILPVQQDNSQWHITVEVNAKQAASANNAFWTFDLAYYRNGGAATLMGLDTPTAGVGNNAGVPPVGWTCTVSQDANQLVVSVTTATGVYLMATANVRSVVST